MADWIRRLPNWLTYFRLALVPVFVTLMTRPTRAQLIAAAIIFVVASFTDYLDGLIARRYKVVSDMGKLLDPLADKILVMSALVMLVAQNDLQGDPWIPAWMVVVLLGREFWVTGLRGLAANQGVIVEASRLGKLKSAAQMVGLTFMIIHEPLIFSGLTVDSAVLGFILLTFSLVLSVWSGFQYTRRVLG